MQPGGATTSPALHAFLKTVSLFSELTDAELDLLVEVATEVDYPRNSQIVRQGDPGGSLLIVRRGEVRIDLERPAGEAVHLSTFRSGDFFGEMSLFDNKPRSATATAVVDSRIVEIGGKAFMSAISQTPHMALSVLAEIASRIRRTDETVRELADKVYREAYSAMHELVERELASIKTIYQKTEERASQTLGRAEQTVGHMEKLWSSMVRFAAPLIAVVLVGLSIYGVKSFNDVKVMMDDVRKGHDEITDKRKQVQEMHARVLSLDKSLKIVKETMTDLRAVRESSALARHIETPDDLRRVAMNYDRDQGEVFERYIGGSDAGARDDFEPEVVLEAVDTYVMLGRGARDDRRFSMNPDQGRKVLDALVYVVTNLPDADDPTHAGRVSWREDRRLRDLFSTVGDEVLPRQRSMTLQELKTVIGTSSSNRTRENIALILASFQEPDDTAMTTLKKMEAGGGWKSALGALALAKLGEPTGWKHLMEQLQEEERAYPAAALLAHEKPASRMGLVEKFGYPGGDAQLIASIKNVINGRINCRNGRCRPFKNCFEERYARYLIDCLDGECEATSTNGPIGGACSLGG